MFLLGIKEDWSRNKSLRSMLVCLIIRGGYKSFMKVLFRWLNLCFVILPYGIEILPGTKIGGGLVLPHLNGIIIHPTAQIGDNCTIYQQVTIGVNDFDEQIPRKAAVIGNNCYIGAGAKIIGNIRIGDNVRIGANAVVISDVPSNCTVVGFNRILARKD